MKFLIAVLCLSISITAQTPSKASAQSEASRTEPGRFRIVALKAPGISTSDSIQPFDEVLLYDSVTGRVWEYNPATFIGQRDDPDRTNADAYFAELTVEGLHGSHNDDLARAGRLYSTMHEFTVKNYCVSHPGGTYTAHGANIDCDSYIKNLSDK